MLFNSVEFFIFLATFFFIYWAFRKSLKIQNILLLVSSYIFYGWWDYRFLFLIFISSLTDFLLGPYIEKSEALKRKLYLSVSLFVNLGMLAYFKYYNFFIDSFIDAFSTFNVDLNFQTLNIILPVGISFYTFQTLSYSIDVYRGRVKPVKDPLVFFNFVSFFPQLVAGPIERAKNFLPQFFNLKKFDYLQVVDGTRQIAWGLFKKMVIADNVGIRVDYIFLNYSSLSSFELFLGSIFFFVQIYADFSGYSDIAIGAAKLLGFKLMTNFHPSLFYVSIPEAWKHWHISLTTWFRDYFFVPVARIYKKSTLWRIFSTVLLFTTIGLWHGANYTFIVFGFFHGLYFIPLLLTKKSKALKAVLKFLSTHFIARYFSMAFVFALMTLTTVFFRAPEIGQAFEYLKLVFSFNVFQVGEMTLEILPYVIAFIVYEEFMRNKKHQFEISVFPKYIRVALYLVLIFSVLLFGNFGDDPFYYFQF